MTKTTTTTTTTSTSFALVVRGGASMVKKDEKEEASTTTTTTTTTSPNLVVAKLQNMIRSTLALLEKKGPPSVANAFRGLCASLEKLMGISLLPSETTKDDLGVTKKSRKRKSKTTASKEDNKDKEQEKKKKKEEEEEAVSGSPQKQKMKKKKPSAAVQAHLSSNIKASASTNHRIQRELREFVSSPPPHLSVAVGKNLRVWIIHMEGAKNSIYQGERFRLRVQFPADYPTSPPSVYFMAPHIPRHEHVYTNGDICLSLLGKDWRPTMTAQSIAMSILSILSSAAKKSLPLDNARHAQNKPGGRQDDWVYHDDSC